MLVHIGYDNFVEGDLVAALLKPDSAPTRKLKNHAAEKGRLINATSGHKTRAVIVLTNGQVVLCALTPQTLKERLDEARKLCGPFAQKPPDKSEKPVRNR